MERVWVVTGSAGQYSDSYWWVESVHETEESARKRIEALKVAASEIEETLGTEFSYADRALDDDLEAFDQLRAEWHRKAREIMDRHAPGGRVPEDGRVHYHVNKDAYEVQP